jgi:RNA polymerase sigma-70 factor (sigma-E family)
MDRDREYVEYVSARLPALHRAAYLLCGDPHQADDIVSATTTALYRHWHRVREADNVDGYVHRTLVRKYADERRMRWARVLLTDRIPERPDGRDGPDGVRVEERDSLRLALAQLTTSQRTVLVLRFFCDLPVGEVARILRCSDGNVKSHTSRGLTMLRRILGVEPAVSAASELGRST